MASMQNVGLGKMVNVGGAYSLNVGMMMNTIVGMNRFDKTMKSHSVSAGKEFAVSAGGASSPYAFHIAFRTPRSPVGNTSCRWAT